MENKTINRILIIEIMKEYIGVFLTIIMCFILLYISIFVARFVIYIFIFYFLISLTYIIQSFKNESLFLIVFKTNKSSKEEAKALVNYAISLYSDHNKNQNKMQKDKMNHISTPIYTRKTDFLKVDDYQRSRIFRAGGFRRVMNSGANRKKRLNKFSRKNALKKIRDDKKRVIVLKRLKWLYDKHEY